LKNNQIDFEKILTQLKRAKVENSDLKEKYDDMENRFLDLTKQKN